jgi:predicted nucleotidyltransferase
LPGRTAGAVLCLALAAGAAAGAVDYPIRFVEATEAGIRLRNVSGALTKDYVVEANGNGAAFFDYDNDGDLDALVVNGSTLDRHERGGDLMAALYRNDGDGRFTDVTDGSGLTRPGWGTGVCAADVDNDGFTDVYITAFGPNVLWHNTGTGTFTRLDQADDPRWGTGCAFGDYDRDGDVDLYVANYVEFDRQTIPPKDAAACRFMNLDTLCGPRPLPGQPDILYRNDGSGGFEDVTEAAGVTEPGYYGFGVLFSDLDDDGWPDIYVANDSLPNLFFRNRRDGTFVEEGLLAGVAVSSDGREQAGMGVDAGDYDGDGRHDLVVSNFAQAYTTLYHNEGGGTFADVSFQTGMAATLGPYLGWGIAFVDLDNNGWLDVFVANGHVYPGIERTGTSTYHQRNQVFRNTDGRRFRDVSAEAGGGLLVQKSSRGAAFGDYDNDGDIDVLVIDIDDRPTLLRNDSAGGHWITIRLVGTTSNRDAIGARVTLEAGGRRQVAEIRSGGSYTSHNDVRAHFGLADRTRVERIEIRWPDGTTESAEGLAADRFYVATEGAGVRPER